MTDPQGPMVDDTTGSMPFGPAAEIEREEGEDGAAPRGGR